MLAVRDRFARNAPRALRAGFLTFLLAQLTVAVLATPWLAVHSEVAHAHAPGTEPHVHPLDELFAAGPVAAPVQRVAVDFGAPAPALPIAFAAAPTAPPSLVHGARGPPTPAA
jgi:hypothetical protein